MRAYIKELLQGFLYEGQILHFNQSDQCIQVAIRSKSVLYREAAALAPCNAVNWHLKLYILGSRHLLRNYDKETKCE